MARKKPGPKRAVQKRPKELIPEGYERSFGELKERIRSAQLRISLVVNRDLVLLYW